MAMYSISVTPLIAALQDPCLKQVWLLTMPLQEVHWRACVTGGPDFKIYAHFMVIIQMPQRLG